ncbi:ComEA family DNA-binding protein [Salinimicrobium flavum]|uniref:ComEA family DNA-binding protein n=1 Tax=Salinimicrobium flavum TaxID=1737065 RepID=A0ABW5IU84_9FLAO
MKNWRSHFVLNRSQQNGIFLLVLVIILLQLVYFFYPFSSRGAGNEDQQQLVVELQRKLDSLKLVASEKDTVVTAPFNPNFISDYKGYTLGMTVDEIDRLHAYRANGSWINSAEDFRKVTGVSDSLLEVISPHFKFPEWRETNLKKEMGQKTISEAVIKQDLNAATAEDLQRVYGIGEKLSERIVKYRESLGGFRHAIQLKDVYGLSPEVIDRVLKGFEVKESNLEKQDINSVTILQLSELPYFNYELARVVIKYRERKGEIQSFEELGQIKEFPVEKIDRIKLYLAID